MAETKKLTATQKKALEKKALEEKALEEKASEDGKVVEETASPSEEVNTEDIKPMNVENGEEKTEPTNSEANEEETKLMNADASNEPKEIATMKTFKLNTKEANFTSVGREFISLTNPIIDIEDPILLKQAEDLVRAGKLIEVKQP